MSYLIVFLTTLVFVSLKAFQQLSVQHDRFWWIPPVSMGMAVCDVVTLTHIIKEGSVWIALPMGIAGGLGCWLAMWSHKHFRKSKEEV